MFLLLCTYVRSGVDEDGKDVKGAKLVSLLLDTFKSGIDRTSKLRLLAVFIASQRDASTEDKRILVQVQIQGLVHGPVHGLTG